MLSVKLDNVNIVILSDGNNPRLLNKDFLERNDIVPKEWKVKDVLVTPPFAYVSYDNGVQVLVEENKIQFQTSKPDDLIWMRELPKIAVSFMNILPHVRYRDVGINMIYLSDQPKGIEAEQALINNLLQVGPWLRYNQGVTGTVLEFQYRTTQPHMNVKIGVLEEMSESGRSLVGFLFRVNFHNELNPEQNEERKTYINSIGFRHDDFMNFLKTLPF